MNLGGCILTLNFGIVHFPLYTDTPYYYYNIYIYIYIYI